MKKVPTATTIIAALLTMGAMANGSQEDSCVGRETSSHMRGRENDIILTDRGERLDGRLQGDPTLSFTFGNITFPRNQIAMILRDSEDESKTHLITKSGQSYIGEMRSCPLQSSAISWEGEFQGNDSFAALLPVNGQGPFEMDRFPLYTLRMSNGDRLTVIVVEKEITIKDGYRKVMISPEEIVKLSKEEGIYIQRHNKVVRQFASYVADRYLSVIVPASDQQLRLRWDAIDKVEKYDPMYDEVTFQAIASALKPLYEEVDSRALWASSSIGSSLQEGLFGQKEPLLLCDGGNRESCNISVDIDEKLHTIAKNIGQKGKEIVLSQQLPLTLAAGELCDSEKKCEIGPLFVEETSFFGDEEFFVTDFNSSGISLESLSPFELLSEAALAKVDDTSDTVACELDQKEAPTLCTSQDSCEEKERLAEQYAESAIDTWFDLTEEEAAYLALGELQDSCEEGECLVEHYTDCAIATWFDLTEEEAAYLALGEQEEVTEVAEAREEPSSEHYVECAIDTWFDLTEEEAAYLAIGEQEEVTEVAEAREELPVKFFAENEKNEKGYDSSFEKLPVAVAEEASPLEETLELSTADLNALIEKIYEEEGDDKLIAMSDEAFKQGISQDVIDEIHQFITSSGTLHDPDQRKVSEKQLFDEEPLQLEITEKELFADEDDAETLPSDLLHHLGFIFADEIREKGREGDYISEEFAIVTTVNNRGEGQSKSVSIGRKLVTNGEYEQFALATGRERPSHWPSGRVPKGQEDKPVTNISGQDAESYAKWRGKRLPTKEEIDTAFELGLIIREQQLDEWIDPSLVDERSSVSEKNKGFRIVDDKGL